jgi:hypothetical protein
MRGPQLSNDDSLASGFLFVLLFIVAGFAVAAGVWALWSLWVALLIVGLIIGLPLLFFLWAIVFR